MAAIRINRYLAMCGLGSRRACEQLVLDGRVAVDGHTVESLSHLVAEKSQVEVDGEPVAPEKNVVVLLHKPPGYLCSKSDPRGRPVVNDLLPVDLKHLSHVGRLDLESEGLLVMTNDGSLAYHLTHPSTKVEKEYFVVLERSFDPKDRRKMLDGIMTEEGMAYAKKVDVLAPRELRIVLMQGLKRQIRLMLAELGHTVRQLKRVRIGNLTDTKLKPGKWRRLAPPEILSLKGSATPSNPRPADGAKAPPIPPPPPLRSPRSPLVTFGAAKRSSPDGIGPRPVKGTKAPGKAAGRGAPARKAPRKGNPRDSRQNRGHGR